MSLPPSVTWLRTPSLNLQRRPFSARCRENRTGETLCLPHGSPRTSPGVSTTCPCRQVLGFLFPSIKRKSSPPPGRLSAPQLLGYAPSWSPPGSTNVLTLVTKSQLWSQLGFVSAAQQWASQGRYSSNDGIQTPTLHRRWMYSAPLSGGADSRSPYTMKRRRCWFSLRHPPQLSAPCTQCSLRTV